MVKFGKAARLDGLKSVIRMQTTINQLMGNADAECTVSFWCRAKVTTGILSYMYMEIDTNGVKLDTTGVVSTYQFTSGFRLFDWNHIVITKSAVFVKIYINNVLQHTVNTGKLNAILNRGTNDNLIGSNGVKFYAIDFDQYYEYSRALRDEEVSMLYNQDHYITNLGDPGNTNRMADLLFATYMPAVASHETDLYIFGGQGHDGTAINKLQMYDTYTNTVSDIVANGVPSGRYGATLNFNLGKLYLIGGQSNENTLFQDVYSFDVVLKTWKKLADCPIKISGHVTAVYKDIIYLIGGHTYSGTQKVNNTTVYAFDIKKNTWSQKYNQAKDFLNDNISLESIAYKGKIYLFGSGDDSGDNVLDQIWCYDIAEDLLEQIDVGRGRLKNRYCSVTQMLNKLYIFYGFDSTTGSCTNRIMTYNLETNQWGLDEEMPAVVTKKYGCRLLSIANAVYIIGGKNNEGNITKSIHVYFGNPS